MRTITVPEWRDLRNSLNSRPWWLLYAVGIGDGMILLTALWLVLR